MSRPRLHHDVLPDIIHNNDVNECWCQLKEFGGDL
jgi:hypothetical protein